MGGRLDPRSLRYRALVAVVLVTMLPLAWVWASGWNNGRDGRAFRAAIGEAVAAVRDGADPEAAARDNHVRLRVLAPDGRTLLDHDKTDPNWAFDPRDPLWGRGGRPEFEAIDAEIEPLPDRIEVRTAAADPSPDCRLVARDHVLLCFAAVRLPDGRVVHAQAGSRRLLRALYEDRFQLAALTVGVLLIGTALALWLGVRMVRPIESLRDQVMARVEGASTAPITLRRSDELGDLAVAFNALLVSLDHRNRSNAVFVGDLAHELKNPVAAVSAAAEALAADKPVDGARKERLQRVLADASARMERVVDAFLDLARAEAGLIDAPREPVALKALCEALIAPFAADPRRAALRFQVVGEEVVVAGVAERLETAVRNLLANAADFATTSVTVTVARDRDRATVCVRDDGPGIDASDLPRVFDRYFSRRNGGSGIGLALTRAIVEAHGGRVLAESPGGAALTLTLPAASANAVG